MSLPFGPIKASTKNVTEKNYRCPDYMKCIDFAIDQNWQSFSCSACRFENRVAPKPQTEIRQKYMEVIHV